DVRDLPLRPARRSSDLLIIVERRPFLTVEPVASGRRCVEAANQVHERRLSGAGWTHDCDVLVALHEEVHAAQGVHCLGAEHIVLAEPLGPDDFAVHQLSDGCAAAAPRRACGAAIGRTAWPSCSDRIASYGPATTESDSVSPLRISKCCAPAMPTSTGTNCALPFRTT